MRIVNFVPFSIGYILDAGSNKSDLSSSRVGIKLPMGVKVPHRHRDLARNAGSAEKWRGDDDFILKQSVERYGCNWHIACQALTWNSGDVNLRLSTVRSARQCLERWKVVNQQDHNSIDCNKHDQCNSQDTSGTMNHMNEQNDISTSLKVIVDPLEITKQNIKLQKENNVRNRFRRLKKANSKRHIIPLTVPGYNSSSPNQAIQTHPSHPSHLQSVKKAVTLAAGASGSPHTKLEMWPLQFLDVAENQRQSAKKRHHSSSGKSSQHVPTHHQHATSHAHGMRQSTASNRQNPLSQQQAARNQSVVSSRSSVPRGQENSQQIPASQPPTSSTYGHNVHPNTAPRMGTNHR